MKHIYQIKQAEHANKLRIYVNEKYENSKSQLQTEITPVFPQDFKELEQTTKNTHGKHSSALRGLLSDYIDEPEFQDGWTNFQVSPISLLNIHPHVPES